jgi:hypothetical protein
MIEHLFANMDGGAQILMGSVGWEDEDDFIFLGEDENDGHTLVRVQLFEGRDITKPINPARAQGHKIICHISSLNGLRIPPKDTRVWVACAKGMENVPGGGVIIAAVEKLPRGAGNVKADENVIFGRDGSQARVVTKNDGTCAMMTTAGNAQGGKAVVLAVSPDGFRFTSPAGSIRLDGSGFHVTLKGGQSFDMGSIQIPGLSDLPGMSAVVGALTGYCTIKAPRIVLNGDLVDIGAGPLWLNIAGFQPSDWGLNAPTPKTLSPALNGSPTVRVSYASP